LRRRFEPAVEPHRAVERSLLVDEQVLQVVAERLKVVLRREVLLLARPARNRVHHAADQLLDRTLAPGRADLSTEVLGDDDVGGLLRPLTRELDVPLLEDQLTALVGDDRGPKLPLNLVERIHPVLRKE